MPRKRIIDPEFWSDEEIAKWPFEARLFYIGLWNFSDDEGRFKAHTSLLRAQIFPYDNRIDIDKLKPLLSTKIQWYSSSGSQYGFIRNFLKYQRIDRPTTSKLPTPPQIDEYSTNTREQLDSNTTKEKISKEKISKAYDFEFLWLKYPNKDGKAEALRHFNSSVKTDQDYEDIKQALENYLICDKVKKGFIKNGSTWFNNWRDWVDITHATGKSKALLDLERMVNDKR